MWLKPKQLEVLVLTLAWNPLKLNIKVLQKLGDICEWYVHIMTMLPRVHLGYSCKKLLPWTLFSHSVIFYKFELFHPAIYAEVIFLYWEGEKNCLGKDPIEHLII